MRCTTTSPTSSVWDYHDRDGRHPQARAAADRRPANALSGGSGADAARRAFRRQARFPHRAGDGGARSSSSARALRDVPAAGFSTRSLKLFQSGHAVRSFELLVKYGCCRYLFPAASAALEGEDGEAALTASFAGPRQHRRSRRARTSRLRRCFLYAVLLWPAHQRARGAQLEQETGATSIEALQRGVPAHRLRAGSRERRCRSASVCRCARC